MPTTITLKSIPDDVYERLKVSATANHRSLNSEVIACLEATLMTRRAAPPDQLAAIRALRARLPKTVVNHDEIDRIKRQGRS
jgi:plasmid stability protein